MLPHTGVFLASDFESFGPDLRNSEWDYFSFEPAEKQPHDKSPWRYRPVTVPKGMEKWFAAVFDAAKAGWKKGLPPFGQYKGRLNDNHSSGRNLWTEKPRALWEHEVLLVRGAWQFPPLKAGHAYRLRVDRGQGADDDLRGCWSTGEFTDDFAKDPVAVAAITFLRYGDRAIVQMPPEPQGFLSMWLEERKMPTLDAETFGKAATMLPMLSSEWQAAHDPDSEEEPNEGLRFRYDGKLVPNEKIAGKWQVVALVNAAEEFDTKGRNPAQ